ncbi:MAG: methyltransferase domain-containing protein [Chloroflexi bacterium]|nr:methyltransferase domain-containing protein [Chloroflexota bacterium]
MNTIDVLAHQEVSEATILRIGSGFRAAKLLFVASEIGLFERLASGPASLDQLATHTGIAEVRLRVLVNAMVALGLLTEDASAYQNAPVAAAYLSGQGQTDLRPALRFWNRLSYPLWTNLPEVLRAGISERAWLDPEQQRIFSEGVQALTWSAARTLATRYAFDQHRRVLDLGGGTGSWLLSILQQHEHLQGTLVEQAAVAGIARQRLASSLDGERFEVLAMDFLREPIPPAHDVVLLAHVLHGFTPAQNLELLRKVRQAVPNGARLLLVDIWVDARHTRPVLSLLQAAEFVAFVGQGDVYSEEEVHAWLGETGWRAISRISLPEPQSAIVAEAVARS